MEHRCLLPLEAWKNYRKNLALPVPDSSEVFNGGSKVLEGFNQNFKGLKEKPLIINEGGLLNKKVIHVHVPGKDSHSESPVICNTEDVSNMDMNLSLKKNVALPADVPEVIVSNSNYAVKKDDNVKVNSVWNRCPYVKVHNLDLGSFLSEDGKVALLHVDKELENAKKLDKALVVKIFEENIPFHALESILLGGPWWIRGQCWDEVNIYRIASLVGKPFLLDGNMFQWSRREFARICLKEKVIMDSSIAIPTGVVGGHVSQVMVVKSIAEGGKDVDNSWTQVKHGKRRFNKISDNTRFFNKKISVPMKKIFLPKPGTSNSKMMGKLIEEHVEANNDILTPNAVVNGINSDVNHVVEILNKFDVLSELIEVNEAEVFDSKNVIGVEEGEILESNTELAFNVSDKGLIQQPEDSRKEDMELSAHLWVEINPLRESLNFLKSLRSQEGEAALYLKEMVKDHRVFFVGLLETKINSQDNSHLMKFLGTNWDSFAVPSIGLSDGLIVLWRSDLATFSVIEATSQMILGKLEVHGKGSWIVASVYDNTDAQERRRLWIDIEKHFSNDLSMIVGGDFTVCYHSLRKEELEEDEGWISFDRLQLLRSKINELNVTLARLNTWWRQMAKARWMDEGDRNSSFFHTLANARRNINWISHINTKDGVISEDVALIQKTFSDFFKLKWQQRKCSLEGWPYSSNVISNVDQTMLDAEFTKEELQIYGAFTAILKIEGGRGLFSAVLMVGPLRAKFAWNFFTKPNSVLNLILKAKYGGDVWSDIVKQCCSPTWKIITMGAFFLKKIVRWEVSNDCVHGLQSDVGKNLLSANIFCNTVCLVWKNRCKLVHGNNEDSDNCNAANNHLAGIGGVVRDEKGRFLVAFGKNSLHWDISHLELLAVLYLKNVVKNWMFEAQGVIIEGDNLNIIKILKKSVKDWKEPRKHGDKEFGLCYIASEAISMASISLNFNLYSDYWGPNHLRLSSNSWHPPPAEWIKVNFDAILLPSNLAIIVGAFRDHNGRFLATFGYKCIHWDVGLMELLAFLALKKIIMDWMMVAKGLIIEGDNYNVMKYLQNSASKVIKEGDSNFTFFHAFANGRRNGNSIKQLKNEDGELIEDPTIIRSSFFQIFCSKWKYRKCQLVNWPPIENILKQEECEILEAIFSLEEVDKVIRELGNNISHGVDGITYSVFKVYWKIIGMDVWKAIQLCFTSGKMSFKWKETLVVLIPKKLDRMCREFLWNKRNGDSGLHYVAWKDLCKLESQGGLGIHSAVDTMESLRAKLYGKNVWDDDRRLNSSSTWKLMLSGAKALRQIVRWIIKDGTSVNIMKDIWILDKRLDSWPTFIANEIGNLTNLSSFISEGVWIPEKLQEFFGEEMLKVICNIKIELENHEDSLELLKIHSGKTISAMARCANINVEENEPMLVQDWNCIKNLKLNPQNAIPTTDFLMHTRLIGSNLCPRGCDMKEDEEHVEVKSLEFKQKRREENPFIAKIYCALVFNSWKSRNKLIHKGQELGAKVIMTNAITYASTSSSNLYSDHCGANQQYKLISSTWHPPPPGWIKVNINASLLNSNEAGIGGIFRDHRGRMLLSFRFSEVHWDIGYMELLAFRSLRRVIKDWKLNAKGLIFEGDNFNVITHLQDSVSLDNRAVDCSKKEDLDFLKEFEDHEYVRTAAMSTCNNYGGYIVDEDGFAKVQKKKNKNYKSVPKPTPRSISAQTILNSPNS
ncbi:hypothetical protein KFK09_000388 [Dendrobium nobile]|uniref:RNase H type-1 domain-containing protein n=1 Tax=Dendrobium nobile TaxID=94219 RepID=A0A8T3CEM1_DENNO|nr:hypothetical protein KFK09_000388 [Dendrobium nobile]